ncbi:diguanylate cyclase [Caballeronia sp. LZ062]|uniref:diguanylate cyclase domain-containing protein n=1 Tax=unclassified Caballeronia TaxID=2646786 RepID=UPI00285B7410|nr:MULTISPECIES: diguanylate cyclase [unclassified Caballeronia]MDR5856432.1 diguanylate cyclase [Caballeronia sp. LZ050]MDR5873102.1 diguanylate cyclase [Caballeronia sp. LZ062]
MSGSSSLLDSLLATPPASDGRITPGIRSSLLLTLLDDIRPLLLAGGSTAFVALAALTRVHRPWAVVWFLADALLLLARVVVVCRYRAARRREAPAPEPWARRYAPFGLAACGLTGLGTMACVMSGDAMLASLAIMVTAGMLGGIASRNAGVPHLATSQICAGTLPIAAGALLGPAGYWMLVPPLAVYIGAMTVVVRRHFRNLVALMTAEAEHAELAARFDAALAHMPHGLSSIDAAGAVVIANRKVAELFGATADMLRLGVPLPEFIGYLALAQHGEALRTSVTARCAQWLKDGHAPLDVTLPDGRQLELSRDPVPDGSAVIIVQDVTERRRAEAKILHWAHHDSLTGLPNRRYLGDHAERLMAGSANREKVMVMYIDLDGFKHVNDSHGHNAGDELLRRVADRLRNAMRYGELAARLGGDEFAIVATYIANAASVAFARRIVRDLSLPYELDAGMVAKVGVSIGIALAKPGESFERALKRADIALYEAKTEGRGGYRFSENDALAAREALEAVGTPAHRM